MILKEYFYRIRCISWWRWAIASIFLLGCAFFSIRIGESNSLSNLLLFQINDVSVNSVLFTLAFVLLAMPFYSFELNDMFILRYKNKAILHNKMLGFRLVIVVIYIILIIVFDAIASAILNNTISCEAYCSSLLISLVLLLLKFFFISIFLTFTGLISKSKILPYIIAVVLFCFIDSGLYSFLGIMDSMYFLPHDYICILSAKNGYKLDLLKALISMIYWLVLNVSFININEILIKKIDIALKYINKEAQ